MYASIDDIRNNYDLNERDDVVATWDVVVTDSLGNKTKVVVSLSSREIQRAAMQSVSHGFVKTNSELTMNRE